MSELQKVIDRAIGLKKIVVFYGMDLQVANAELARLQAIAEVADVLANSMKNILDNQPKFAWQAPRAALAAYEKAVKGQGR